MFSLFFWGFFYSVISCYKCTLDWKSNFLILVIQLAKKIYCSDPPSVKFGRQDHTGIPYVILGNKRFDCQFGVEQKKKDADKMINVSSKVYQYYLARLGCPYK